MPATTTTALDESEADALRRRNHQYYMARRKRQRKAGMVVRCDVMACHYCGHKAVEEVERIDVDSGETIRVPYCGKC